MSTQGGQFSTMLKVQNIKTPQGGLCRHKVDYSTGWTVPRKVDWVYTRWIVSTQGGQVDRWTGKPGLHKVDCVYAMWTVLHKVEGAEHKDSTRWTMSPQSDYSTGWTVPRKVDCVYTR